MSSFRDPTKIDPTRIPDDQWEFEGFADGGTSRTFVYWVDRENGTFIRKKENVIERDLIAENRERYDQSHGVRFGDGQVVARVPLNIFYRDIAPRLKQGDKDFNKWWLNHDDNRMWRNFRGKL